MQELSFFIFALGLEHDLSSTRADPLRGGLQGSYRKTTQAN